jgi:hypothetical protein
VAAVFSVEANGNEPLGAFLSSLDLKKQARFEWSMEQLRKGERFWEGS